MDEMLTMNKWGRLETCIQKGQSCPTDREGPVGSAPQRLNRPSPLWNSVKSSTCSWNQLLRRTVRWGGSLTDALCRWRNRWRMNWWRWSGSDRLLKRNTIFKVSILPRNGDWIRRRQPVSQAHFRWRVSGGTSPLGSGFEASSRLAWTC